MSIVVGVGSNLGAREAAILAARDLELTDDQQSRIRQCGDDQLLDQWLDRALKVKSVDELLH